MLKKSCYPEYSYSVAKMGKLKMTEVAAAISNVFGIMKLIMLKSKSECSSRAHLHTDDDDHDSKAISNANNRP